MKKAIKIILVFIFVIPLNIYAQRDLTVLLTADHDTICYGNTVNITAHPSGGNGEYSFYWTASPTDPSLAGQENLPNIVVTPNVSTTYHISVSDGNEVANAEITIYLLPILEGSAGPDQGIYEGTTTILNGLASGGSGNYLYDWQPSGLLEQNDIANPTTLPLYNSRIFILILDDEQECQSIMDTAYVYVFGDSISINPIASPDSICFGETILVNANASGGGEEYSYQWMSNPVGFTSTLQNILDDPLFTTTYIVHVMDQFGSEVFDSVTVIVNPLPNVYNFTDEDITICPDSPGIPLVLVGSETGANYQLYRNSNPIGNVINGNGLSIDFGSYNQEGDYSVEAFKVGCTSIMDGTTKINHLEIPESDPICLVTVDTISDKNEIIWEKSSSEKISSYNIYRESTVGGIFEFVGNVPYSGSNSYMDNSSIPLQRSYTYVLKTVDTCNSESPYSNTHQTIHLNISAGINAYNLHWNEYIGFDYSTYYIYRKILPGGFVLIDSISNNLFSYTDINPPGGDLSYMIEVRRQDGCGPIRQGSYSSVLSNIKNTFVGINDKPENRNYKITPNPVGSLLTIDCETTSEEKQLVISNMMGEDVITQELNGPMNISMRGLSKGVYVLCVKRAGTVVYTEKIIKN